LLATSLLTDDGGGFRSFLEVEIALSQDQIGKYADKIMLYSNTCMKELRRLFLVQDLVDSLKVGASYTLRPWQIRWSFIHPEGNYFARGCSKIPT